MASSWRNDELSDDMLDMSDVEMDDVVSLRDVFEVLGLNILDNIKDENLDRIDIMLETMERVQESIVSYNSEIMHRYNHEDSNFLLLTAIGELDEISFAETYGTLMYKIANNLYDNGDYALSYLFSHSTVQNMSMFEEDCGDKKKIEGGKLIASVCDLGCKALFWMVDKQPRQEGKLHLLKTMDLYVDAIASMDPEQRYIDLSYVRFHIAGNYAFFDELVLAEREYLQARDFVQSKHPLDMHKYSIVCKAYIKLSQLYFKSKNYDAAFGFSTHALMALDTAEDFKGEEEKDGWREHMHQVHHANAVKLNECVAADIVKMPFEQASQEANAETNQKEKKEANQKANAESNKEISAEASQDTSADPYQEDNGECCEEENGESFYGDSEESCREESE